jgi:dTDP-4-dehydrorhamnose reductase
VAIVHPGCGCDVLRVHRGVGHPRYLVRMRVLVTGGTGQLGQALARTLGAAGDDFSLWSSSDLDVGNREQVLQIVGGMRPDVIIHGGAWTDVDGCETDPERAYRINAWGSRVVAEAADLCGARVVGVSTDYVFSGRGGGPGDGRAYHEWDATDPLNEYGRSKLAGEHELLNRLGSRACVVRTAWVCGPDGKNFLKTMLRLAEAGAADRSTLTVVNDQHGSPTFTDDLALAIRELAVRRASGVVHVSNPGATTWFDFAAEIFRRAGHDPSRVIPVTTEELLPKRPAPRPKFSLLGSMARDGFGITPLPEWPASLQRALVALGRE